MPRLPGKPQGEITFLPAAVFKTALDLNADLQHLTFIIQTHVQGSLQRCSTCEVKCMKTKLYVIRKSPNMPKSS